MFALALALIGFFLSLWIAVPGPVLPLFALGVGATEAWPILCILNVVAAVCALRSHGRFRTPALMLSICATGFTLLPAIAYLGGAHVPVRAFFEPWPLRSAQTARAGAPAVLAIYGGAWQRGSPRNDAALNATIASWGYRVIALDYPHAPQARWPAQRDAVLKHIDALHGGRFVLLGHSSGSQLAMIAGAMRPERIAGIITYASPVDLELGYRYPSQPDVIGAHKIMRDLCGGTPEEQPACFHSASPRYAVRPGMPPVLMLAGARDHVVNLEFEGVLRDTLRRDGMQVTYVELPWADHSFETVPFGFHNHIALWYIHQFLDRL